MVRFIVRRVVRGLIALVLFQSLLFALVHALPGNAANLQRGGGAAWQAHLVSRFGLDRPLGEQYVRWLLNFVRLDLGTSFQHRNVAVSEIMAARTPRTLLLFLTAALLAALLGVWLGKLLAWHRSGMFEAAATLVGVAAYTSFAPWLAFVMTNVFGIMLGWFPLENLVNYNVWVSAPVTVEWLLARLVLTGALAAGALLLLWNATRRLRSVGGKWLGRVGGLVFVAFGAYAWWSWLGVEYLALDILHHLTLPLLTVVLLSFGELMMIMRATMLETMGEDFVLMAHAKGLPDSVVRDRHIARYAIMPVLTRFVLSLPLVLVGSLIIERIFFWRGMGQALFDAIDHQDIPVLLGLLSFVGVLSLVAHVGLDILYVYLDPRLRISSGD